MAYRIALLFILCLATWSQSMPGIDQYPIHYPEFETVAIIRIEKFTHHNGHEDMTVRVRKMTEDTTIICQTIQAALACPGARPEQLNKH